MQQMWHRELGVAVTLSLQEQRVWLDDESSLNFDLSNAAWVGDYVDPYNFLELFLSFGGNNRTGWKNADYDRLLQAASVTADETERNRLYGEAETLLLEKATILPIYHGTQAYLIRPEVSGWPPALLGLHRFQKVHLTSP